MASQSLNSTVQYLRSLFTGNGLKDHPDAELLRRFHAMGDQGAFAELVQRHGAWVLGVCRRVLNNDHDAEEAFQATFLVLARKGATLRWNEKLSNWLHGVALRTSQKLRTMSARRQRHEHAAAEQRHENAPPAADATNDDWQVCVDEELQRMPAKLRDPLLMCYLQGLSREETAHALGWSVGAVKGSLERGREWLRSRMAKRGILCTTLFLVGTLSASASQAVPPALVTATVQGVSLGSSTAVASLAKSVIAGMAWGKAKAIIAASLLLVGVAGGGGWIAWSYAGNHEATEMVVEKEPPPRATPVNLPLPPGSTVERLPSIPLQPLLPPNLCIIVTNQGTFLVRLDPATRSATYERIEDLDEIED
jgi:RNA polymerase sigma factor (sigma-70 family)